MNELFPIGLWLQAQHDAHVVQYLNQYQAKAKAKAAAEAEVKWQDWYRSVLVQPQ